MIIINKHIILPLYIANTFKNFSKCSYNNIKNNDNNNTNNNNNDDDTKKDDTNEQEAIKSKLIKYSIDNTKVVTELEKIQVVNGKNKNNKTCVVSIYDGKTIDSTLYFIKNNKNDKVCILNFANWLSPGRAQEGSIRDATIIDRILTSKNCKENFYKPHNDLVKNDINADCKANDDIIYSPDVIILKNDSGNNLNTFENKVDIISCAAPNNQGNKINNDELKKIHRKRMQKILDVAAFYDVDIIILGAFGCGVFNNDAKTVAETYKELLLDTNLKYNTLFKKIVFAIPTCYGDKNNEIFSEVFKDFNF